MSDKKTITLQQAIAVRDVIKHGLVKGVGKPEPGQMCVEAAVCYALGQPHGDDPECVAPSVRAFKIALNDAEGWPSDVARGEGLMEIGIAQLGTRDAIDENEFAKKLSELTIRRILPITFRALASLAVFAGEHAEKLNACADLCEKEGTASAAWSAESAAWSAESQKHSILKLAASIGVEALRHVGARGVELLDQITKEGL